ncbi:MAG TPA: hypothetical protein PK876_02870 [Elusimicrobiota bacterium]|nr:hypothetical protein [Elusimicrobiota bacterium]
MYIYLIIIAVVLSSLVLLVVLKAGLKLQLMIWLLFSVAIASFFGGVRFAESEVYRRFKAEWIQLKRQLPRVPRKAEPLSFKDLGDKLFK